MGDRQYGIDPKRLKEYAEEIKQVIEKGVEVAIVIGGGNIFRGVAGASNGMDRVQGDHMGMLATMIKQTSASSMARLLCSRICTRIFSSDEGSKPPVSIKVKALFM